MAFFKAEKVRCEHNVGQHNWVSGFFFSCNLAAVSALYVWVAAAVQILNSSWARAQLAMIITPSISGP